MAAPRSFAALIDQDSVSVLEFHQEKAGFRIGDSRTVTRRFTTPEQVVATVVELLAEMKARSVVLSIVLQHFGSFFHSLVLPPAPDETIRPIILREVQRSFNIADPVIAFTTGVNVERRDAARSGGQVPRQVFIAGAPRSVVDAFQAGFARARIKVAGMTVIPEVFRRLYDALDGSTEATAVLICLHNGPHVAFFANSHLELAIEPPLALEGEAPLDTAVIIDQLERGAIFLRQQSRGAVATRLLLSAPAADFEALSSTIEARTGMRVAELGHGVGAPETVVAMGAVLAARGDDRLDLFPRAPSLDERMREAVSGPSLVVSAMLAAALIAAMWCGAQLWTLSGTMSEMSRLETRVQQSLPAVNAMRASVQGRERIAGIRSALAASAAERRAVSAVLSSLAAPGAPAARLDSVTVLRDDKGFRTRVFGRSTAPTGPAAMGLATALYRRLQQQPRFSEFEFESSYLPRSGAAQDELRFTISFVAFTEGTQ